MFSLVPADFSLLDFTTYRVFILRELLHLEALTRGELVLFNWTQARLWQRSPFCGVARHDSWVMVG